MAFRYRRYYGPGRGRGYGRGYARGPRGFSPYCDWYPDRPRGWWALPEYQSQIDNPEFIPPLRRASWPPYDQKMNLEEINYEISILEQEIERLNKAIINLQSLKESLDES